MTFTEMYGTDAPWYVCIPIVDIYLLTVFFLNMLYNVCLFVCFISKYFVRAAFTNVFMQLVPKLPHDSLKEAFCALIVCII